MYFIRNNPVDWLSKHPYQKINKIFSQEYLCNSKVTYIFG
jgi:hypothetical protein